MMKKTNSSASASVLFQTHTSIFDRQTSFDRLIKTQIHIYICMHIHFCVCIGTTTDDDDNRCMLAMIRTVNRQRRRRRKKRGSCQVIDFLRKERKFEEGEMRHTLQFEKQIDC